MKKPNESKPRDLDVVSRELQNLIYITSSDKIAKILNKLNFKGKLQSNKILQGMQIIQNFNTVEKNGNVYVITIKDENIYDGTLLMTKFTLDTSKNLLVYQWYDKYYDLTIVQTFKQTTVISN